MGPSCLVICIALLVAGEVGEIVKIASKAMQSLVGAFDHFANFFVACVSGRKRNRGKDIGEWAGGRAGGGLQRPQNLGNLFFGQQEKLGQSQFLKKFARVCVCLFFFFRREIFSILN